MLVSRSLSRVMARWRHHEASSPDQPGRRSGLAHGAVGDEAEADSDRSPVGTGRPASVSAAAWPNTAALGSPRSPGLILPGASRARRYRTSFARGQKMTAYSRSKPIWRATAPCPARPKAADRATSATGRLVRKPALALLRAFAVGRARCRWRGRGALPGRTSPRSLRPRRGRAGRLGFDLAAADARTERAAGEQRPQGG